MADVSHNDRSEKSIQLRFAGDYFDYFNLKTEEEIQYADTFRDPTTRDFAGGDEDERRRGGRKARSSESGPDWTSFGYPRVLIWIGEQYLNQTFFHFKFIVGFYGLVKLTIGHW